MYVHITKKPQNPYELQGTRFTRVATLVGVCNYTHLTQLTPANRLFLLSFEIAPQECLRLAHQVKCSQPMALSLFTSGC